MVALPGRQSLRWVTGDGKQQHTRRAVDSFHSVCVCVHTVLDHSSFKHEVHGGRNQVQQHLVQLVLEQSAQLGMLHLWSVR